MSWLVFDLETYVPSMRPEAEFQPWALHRPIALSMLRIDSKGHEMHSHRGFHDDEEWMRIAVKHFRDLALGADCVVSWNGRRFDVPLLALTATRLDVRMAVVLGQLEQRYRTYRGEQPKHFDASEIFGRYGGPTPALADVAAALGVPCKTAMEGMDVRDAYERGELARISGYCNEDCIVTALVASRIGCTVGIISAAARDMIEDACGDLLDKVSE